MEYFWLVVVVVIVFSFIVLIWCGKIIKFNKIVIKSEKIDKDIDIVFVSDFHVGKYMKKRELEKVVSLINEIDGDVLLVGGDMVGINVLKFYKDNELKEIIDKLRIKERYFVGGNHDDYSLSLYDNFKVLNNEIIQLTSNVFLTGLSWEKGECLDYKLNRDNYNILLSHYPDRIMDYSKVDLGLGAHSHGLQVNLPFFRFHHKEKYTRGFYRLNNDKNLYVNKGLGFSLFKIRFLSCKEIVKIELRKC